MYGAATLDNVSVLTNCRLHARLHVRFSYIEVAFLYILVYRFFPVRTYASVGCRKKPFMGPRKQSLGKSNLTP